MLIALGPAAAGEAPGSRLKISAEPPVVTIVATAPGRRSIDLPSLQYRFEVETECDGDRAPRSLSINVADTRLALSGAALEGQPGRELVLTVPGRQLAPIAMDDFCVLDTRTDDDEPPGAAPTSAPGIAPSTAMDAKRLLTVPAVISAQASLVCGGGDGQEISYLAVPLGVTLECAAPAGHPSDSPP